MYQSIKHREALEWEADASLTKNDCSFAGLMKMSGWFGLWRIHK
jgi:hypothetical protein